ncbi:hypothetical protein BC829DRAFT_424151 [Chytridium lagenaria]|nr:hypothetical protein BC829DRAFT_424151 [Chytridium lagenaria]
MYPKAYNRQISVKRAANNRALKRVETALFNITSYLRGNQDKISGIRVEIRIRIWSMQDLSFLGFEFHHIPTDAYIQDITMALQSSTAQQLFNGRNHEEPSERKQQMLKALINNFGWNDNDTLSTRRRFQQFTERHFGSTEFLPGDVIPMDQEFPAGEDGDICRQAKDLELDAVKTLVLRYKSRFRCRDCGGKLHSVGSERQLRFRCANRSTCARPNYALKRIVDELLEDTAFASLRQPLQGHSPSLSPSPQEHSPSPPPMPRRSHQLQPPPSPHHLNHHPPQSSPTNSVHHPLPPQRSHSPPRATIHDSTIYVVDDSDNVDMDVQGHDSDSDLSVVVGPPMKTFGKEFGGHSHPATQIVLIDDSDSDHLSDIAGPSFELVGEGDATTTKPGTRMRGFRGRFGHK